MPACNVESEETTTFKQALGWCGFVVVGFGHAAHFVDVATRNVRTWSRDSYFSSFEEGPGYLLVSSAERVFCFGTDSSLSWKSEPIGLDGVVISHAGEARIRGQGEWDPPAGWRDFVLDAVTGNRVA